MLFMKKYALFILVFAFAFSLASVAFAQDPVPSTGILPPGFTLDNPGEVGAITDQATLTATILRLISWFAWIIALAAVVMGLYAGILFITAGGDSGKVETARNILLYAIIGIVVAIVAFGLVAISRAVIGI